MDHVILVGPRGCSEQLGQASPGSLPGPSLSSNGPSFVSTRAAPSPDFTELGHTLDKSVLVTPHVSLGPQSSDTSNNKHSKHVAPASGPKWSRVLRSSHGSKEALLSLAGKKRVLGWIPFSLNYQIRNSRFFKMKMKIQLIWWRLVPSPAKDYEYYVLELSGAWEPADSSRARGYYPGTRSYSCILSRNMAG